VTSIFPMFMKLAGKRCLVVGAGKVGEPKIGGLIDTGARIHVVAIKASSRVREWADAGKIKLELRTFSENDLDGKFLAVFGQRSIVRLARGLSSRSRRGALGKGRRSVAESAENRSQRQAGELSAMGQA